MPSHSFLTNGKGSGFKLLPWRCIGSQLLQAHSNYIILILSTNTKKMNEY